MTHTATGTPIAFVAIGAMLVRTQSWRICGSSLIVLRQVGSIVWTNGVNKGSTVKRGEELGHFAYGGSTIVVLFPKGFMEYAWACLLSFSHRMLIGYQVRY